MFVTKQLLETRYPGAEVIFVAGSVVRGEATEHSDLDLVVVYSKIPAAYRESFQSSAWPVEAFIHDPATLRYFFKNVDRDLGRATLAEMIAEGHEIPGPSEFSQEIKRMARAVLDAGPPVLPDDEIQDRRYHISELIDDLRAPRSQQEVIASATLIYNELADYYFRTNGYWSGTGKALIKRMKRYDPVFARRFGEAFDALFGQSQTQKVIDLANELMAPKGGYMFEGYRREVPSDWRE
jgi:hypothetical protein